LGKKKTKDKFNLNKINDNRQNIKKIIMTSRSGKSSLGVGKQSPKHSKLIQKKNTGQLPSLK